MEFAKYQQRKSMDMNKLNNNRGRNIKWNATNSSYKRPNTVTNAQSKPRNIIIENKMNIGLLGVCYHYALGKLYCECR